MIFLNTLDFLKISFLRFRKYHFRKKNVEASIASIVQSPEKFSMWYRNLKIAKKKWKNLCGFWKGKEFIWYEGKKTFSGENIFQDSEKFHEKDWKYIYWYWSYYRKIWDTLKSDSEKLFKIQKHTAVTNSVKLQKMIASERSLIFSSMSQNV